MQTTAKAFLFDVEGTLVDSVGRQLSCWHEVLAQHGFDIPATALQRYSGMDGGDMMARILPDVPQASRRAMVQAQGRVFEQKYLDAIFPFPGVRDALQKLKSVAAIALATDCKGASLRHYRDILGIDALLDAVACGEDVEEGKPSPALLVDAALQLALPASACVMVGDTPYDAQAARVCGMPAIGVLTGGFAVRDLVAAGCSGVINDVGEISSALGPPLRLAAAPGVDS